MAQKNADTPFFMKPEKIMKAFAWLCGAVMVFNMLLIGADVIMRYFFNKPIQGATEVCVMMMAWIAYLGLSYTLMTGQHMQLGLVYDKLAGRKAHVFAFLIYLLGFLLYAVLIYASWLVFIASYRINETAVSSVTVYVWIGKLGPVIGWCLMAVQSAFMVAYSAFGIAHPAAIQPIGHRSELPTDAELSDFS
jgi:TRAP-type C4-dicarboxylate transport system permease small subunit